MTTSPPSGDGRLTVACVQNCATPDMEANLERCEGWTRKAAAAGAGLICLPEYFAALDLKGEMLLGQPFVEDEHPALARFAALAAELRVSLLLGSLAVTIPGQARFVNRALFVDSAGNIRARYDKIHMFDVALANGESYRESATVAPGDTAVLADTDWGPLGLSICYDLRFPALYRDLALAGARMLAVPAAFTRTTGAAHWHVLLRARAIETGSFVFAPCQHGSHAGDRACYGHSLIIDPWGRILAEGAADESGFILAEIDLAESDRVRAMIPSLAHGRPFHPASPAPVPARETAA